MKKALSLILALIIMAVPATAFAEADEDAPIIWMSSLQIMISDNKSFATAGDTVTIAVPVTDNVKVESVIIGVESPSGKQNVTKYMTQYEDSEWYYMSIAITENTEAGYWNVARIKATDSSGHYMYITSLTMYQFGVKGVIENGDVSFTKGTKYTYSPAGVKPDIKVAHKGVALEKDVDYLVKYQNNTKVGTATATVTGIGCFDGVVSKTFTIVPQTKFTVKLSTTRYTYNGKVKNPAVTVYDGKSVVPKSNYTVTYPAGRKNVGKYYVNRLYFGGPKSTEDHDCSHEIKRCLLLGRKTMTNLENILKSRDITLLTKSI